MFGSRFFVCSSVWEVAQQIRYINNRTFYCEYDHYTNDSKFTFLANIYQPNDLYAERLRELLSKFVSQPTTTTDLSGVTVTSSHITLDYIKSVRTKYLATNDVHIALQDAGFNSRQTQNMCRPFIAMLVQPCSDFNSPFCFLL
jgi:hypothetical protein